MSNWGFQSINNINEDSTSNGTAGLLIIIFVAYSYYSYFIAFRTNMIVNPWSSVPRKTKTKVEAINSILFIISIFQVQKTLR